MRRPSLRLIALSTLVAGCGLDPLPKLSDSGGSSITDSGESDVVQLGDLRIEPASLAFGVQTLDAEVVESVVLTNTGSDTIIVRMAELSGDAAFTNVSTMTLPSEMSEGGEVVVQVGFTPTAADS